MTLVCQGAPLYYKSRRKKDRHGGRQRHAINCKIHPDCRDSKTSAGWKGNLRVLKSMKYSVTKSQVWAVHIAMTKPQSLLEIKFY